MTLLRFENPALARVLAGKEEEVGEEAGAPGSAVSTAAIPGQTMTVQGTVEKTAVLLVLVVASAAISWRVAELAPSAAVALLIGGSVAGLVVAIVTAAEPRRAPVGAPLYAGLEGISLGALSYTAEQELPGVVVQATVATLAVLGAMLLAYRLGLIRATATFTRFVVTATGAIAVTYVLDLVLAVAGVDVPFLHAGGALGALVSLAVIGVVALNLVLDFALVEEGAREGADKQLEWYGAFGLVVTLVWLYVEILLFILEHLDEDGDFGD